MNEQEYLSKYDRNAYLSPLVTVDAVLFTYHEETLKVLLVERANHPDKGMWGLPGGFIDEEQDSTLEQAILRKLKEKTGVIPPYIEQLCTVGNHFRDKRGWSVTVCYTALIAYQACQHYIDSVGSAKWVAISDIENMSLAFDHSMLYQQARERLKQKSLYSIVPGFALPEVFTLTELQHVHEVLIGKTLQKKSFRRRLEQADLLIDTGEKRQETGRPANLYRLKPESADYRFIRNLEF
ncbi:TPA: NUDIX domain-containing protein [Providencia stuartii]|uniref:Hydrolase, NUDIX family n=1 Tax=Providencia stuartii ATCC 25827 TaxID=471874 RepID=A0AA87CTB1_PROST|nr:MULTISPECIES: NUDIX domain-containing protein [Providencia]AIN63439.1 mutT/nudix family protein [Providencia stuartii]AMG66887.1 NUDIX domain-containing protein [Providencia stuartii]APG52770.1 NUDIX hydrolase [Providencia stuartii]AVE42578.1 NUDIX domain-containing protein [Providencia stuartii]AVL41061.1 NUDIX domain-containing protein [Providencia stuartii]